MTTTYTPTLRLAKPDFRSIGWQDAVNNNMDAVDAGITNAILASNITVWDNAVLFSVGNIAMDDDDSPPTYWICSTEHTSPASPTTFAQDRAANPLRWTSIIFGITPRGEWANNTDYGYYDIAYDSTQGIVGLCLIPHTSNASGDIQDDEANWIFIVDLPSVGVTAASTISFDNSGAALPGAPTNVQTAIVAVDTRIDNAATVAQDHETRLTAAEGTIVSHTGSLATNASNISTIDGRVDTLETSDADHETRIDTLEDTIAELGQGIPSGTNMLFFQASAPTGWTKQTTHNDKALRVVSGTGGGSAGTNSFSSTFSKTTTDATTLTTGTIPSHTHSDYYQATSLVGGSGMNGGDGFQLSDTGASTTTGATGSGGSHTHAMDIRVQYLDVIICSKNA